MKKFLLILALAVMCSSIARGDDDDDLKKIQELGEKGEHVKALKLTHTLAAQGNAALQYLLANVYYQGSENETHSIKKDYKEAAKWYRMAAEQGIPEAQNGLGHLYKDGEGVKQDYKEAVKWYRKAAEQGESYGQFSLGEMYKGGHGVIQDIVNAHKWFNIASSNGNVWAEAMIELIKTDMTTAQIAEAQKLARECVKKKYKNCD